MLKGWAAEAVLLVLYTLRSTRRSTRCGWLRGVRTDTGKESTQEKSTGSQSERRATWADPTHHTKPESIRIPFPQQRQPAFSVRLPQVRGLSVTTTTLVPPVDLILSQLSFNASEPAPACLLSAGCCCRVSLIPETSTTIRRPAFHLRSAEPPFPFSPRSTSVFPRSNLSLSPPFLLVIYWAPPSLGSC